jgi:hypothetical protein
MIKTVARIDDAINQFKRATNDWMIAETDEHRDDAAARIKDATREMDAVLFELGVYVRL